MLWLLDALRGLLALFGLVKERRTLIIVGLDNAGKTTLLHKLKYGEVRSFVPTQRPTSEEIMVGNVSVRAWDLGGHRAVRALWDQYEGAADAIAFVVDAADAARLDEARDELARTLALADERRAPVAVLANKQDRRTALKGKELQARLGIAKRVSAVTNGTASGRCPVRTFECSLVTGVGFVEALRWLVEDDAMGSGYEQ